MDWKDLSNQTNIELLLHKRISHKKLMTMSEIKSIYQEFDLRIRNILDTVFPSTSCKKFLKYCNTFLVKSVVIPFALAYITASTIC